MLEREGAERVYFLATHGVFSRGSFATIASAGSPDRDICLSYEFLDILKHAIRYHS